MNKKKIILITASVIALIALFLVLLYANRREYDPGHEGGAGSESGTGGEDKEKLEIGNWKLDQNTVEVARKQASPEEIEEENIKNLAKIFVERWGSWSTDGDFSNFESLKGQMTEEMGEEIGGDQDGFKRIRDGWTRIADETDGGDGGFYGVTTKALSAKIEGKTGNSASVRVSYQKQETISCRDGASSNSADKCPVSAGSEGNEEVKISYGEAAVELEKEGESKYLVSSIK